MSFKDFLIKAKLVEPDPVEAELEGASSGPGELIIETVALSPNADAATESGGIAENTPLETIYAGAGLPASNFPAERLLKVLDGLRAMDAVHQRAAVAAMDAADDSWQIEDVLADAARKVKALHVHVSRLGTALAAVQEQEKRQKAKLNQDYEALRQSIAEQMAQLQEAAQLAAGEHANALNALEAKTLAAVGASQREQRRLQQEIERLEALGRQLGQDQQA
ncbi:hypothetical protein [Chitinimonas taiwanensis]|uniref:Uncharacterized protein n=1 Tax=Chitinimonas taiwanensis DSM 18899 TaxID=1121279 RepID=A0A1K2HI71_9NEIS|nr:hypothetical protein [Chitinimonas taiwanensis]SFZ76479.1 hypothetical protein SAMN02745887_01975 [Chitinimonas taiwanensis DSM 18899]